MINEWLKYLLKAFEQEEEIVVNEEDMFLVIKEIGEDTGSQFCDVFIGIQRGVIDYMTAIRKLRDTLLFEIKFADRDHELDIVEGDAYKSIKEVRVEAIFGTSFGAISRAVPRAMSIGIHIAISRVVFEEILKVKT